MLLLKVCHHSYRGTFSPFVQVCNYYQPLKHTSIKNNICLQTEENLDKLIGDGKQFNKVAVIHKTGLESHVGRYQAIAK